MTEVRLLQIHVSAGDAEMVASWAAEGLKDHDNPVARECLARFRMAFSKAASVSLLGACPADTPMGTCEPRCGDPMCEDGA